MDFTEALQEGQGTLAWLTAVMLSLGATAVIVAVWLQLRRGVSARTVLKALLGMKPQAEVRTPPATSPRTGDVRSAGRDPADEAVRAYRAVAGERPTPPPTAPRAAAPVLTERQLNVYLDRLRSAADALETVARGEDDGGAAPADPHVYVES